MFGFRKGAAPAEKPPRQTSNDPDDSDDEDSSSAPKNMGRRTASEPNLDSMSVQELEGYAVNQAEQTTRSVNNCLKIAEDIRGDASRTLETLHAQGDQIHRTHGEKLLNSLGGMFSMPWKPKKGKAISGPATSKDDNDIPKRATKEQRQKLGVDRKARGSRAPDGEPTSALQKVDMEKDKQDDGLSDLSDILGDLKGMAVEMGSELDKQNKALDSLDEDVDELNSRVKGANTRARKLLN
ncbi:hypothetical protein SASPL_110443 [Salvia splendens]|uniref:t-SNARE coiled-coil homology domain-containing protein n=1 Tax=Salvia splendens TaxID=180675 RepID=A0A8X9A2R2_SALSN|nr:hypothetical protein SASPL_110443 [Salvia splendens]